MYNNPTREAPQGPRISKGQQLPKGRSNFGVPLALQGSIFIDFLALESPSDFFIDFWIDSNSF